MNRLINEHTLRNKVNLNQLWDFIIDPNDIGESSKWYANFPKECTKIVVPSCWQNEMGYFDYEGVAWYATKFYSDASNIKLHFGGVTGLSKVYIDGDLVGVHYGDFTEFSFILSNLTAGSHKLVVRVDNTSNNENTIPLKSVDWYHYGGIIREVSIWELGDVWIDNYKIDYTFVDGYKKANLKAQLQINSTLDTDKTVEMTFDIDGNNYYGKTVTVSNKTEIEFNVDIDNIKLWEPTNPVLYNIRLSIGTDDVIDRIGFREITTQNGKILLNGKPIEIKGINRHEDHPDWGSAIPLKLMMRDVDIIKNMGCNAIRSHYPPAKAFIDLCDESGMLYWSEIPMWQYSERHFTNPLVIERSNIMAQEMIKRDYHSPATIIWSVHNEVDTAKIDCYNFSNNIINRVKMQDSSRLVTFASDRPMTDICFELADIICINNYTGWYGDDLDKWPRFLDNVTKRLEENNLGDKPIIISEFGAGAIFGNRTFDETKWSENFQDTTFEYLLDLFDKHERISGYYIWQYCDTRIPNERALSRPRSYNNKGIVNEYRQPKQAYWTIKRYFS